MQKTLAIILCALALTGCATGQQYTAYSDAHKAQATAQVARYEALAKIAEMGDTTAKVAAVMSLQMGGGQSQSQIAAPVSASDRALQWASVLVPGLTQAYMIGQNTKLGMRQSDNAATTSAATTAGFVGIAGKIQAPAANVSTSTTTTIGANSGANSGNSGRLAGTSITDNTATPTVVLQPVPLVVTQPAPIIVRP